MRYMRNKKVLIVMVCAIIAFSLSFFIGYTFSETALQTEVTNLTKQRIKEIRATGNTDISKRTGQVFYVSADGDDTNNGKSEDKPFKTLSRVQKLINGTGLAAGDTILFRRGDEFRGQLTVSKNNITLGSYGDTKKAKPIINVSTYDGTKTGEWVKVKNNIWKYTVDGSDQVFKKDIGEIWFFCKSGNNNCDRTTTMGDRKYKISQKKLINDDIVETEADISNYLKHDLEFMHYGHPNGNSATGGALYVYSATNPASRFDEIEFNVGTSGIYAAGITNLVVDNLDIRHAGRHGVNSGTTANLKVSNCELSYIGGMVQKYDAEGHWALRLGNAVEIYGSVTSKNNYSVDEGYVVENSYIYEVYDAGLTFQYTAAADGSSAVEKVDFNNNVIEYASYNIEYWNDVNKPETITSEWLKSIDRTYLNKIYFRNNIMRFAGMGFTETRPEHGYEALIKAWDGGHETAHNKLAMNGEFLIENNIFDTTGVLKDNKGNDVGIWMLHLTAGYEESIPTVRNNRFYNYTSRNLGRISSSEATNWTVGAIPYSTQLKYDTNWLKDNEFYAYDGLSDPTGTKSGTSGSTSWSLNLNNHTLTISGSGDMADYTVDSLPPWSSYSNYIHKIVIGEDVTKIGKYAFNDLKYINDIVINSKNLKNMTGGNAAFRNAGVWATGATLTFGPEVTNIPGYLGNATSSSTSAPNIKKVVFKGNKVKTIGSYAFTFLLMTDMVIPDSVETIGEAAFANCKVMKLFVLSNNVVNVPNKMLRGCTHLETVILGEKTVSLGVEALYNSTRLECLVIQNVDFAFDSTNNPINNFNGLYQLRIFGPSSIKAFVDAANEQVGSEIIKYVDLIYYRPVVYGDHKTFYALHDEAYINENTTYQVKSLSNASSVTVTGAKYRYMDAQKHYHLVDGVNMSGNTISNIMLDVELEGTVSDDAHRSIDDQTVVFLGNSLLRGFDTHGMASTTTQDDYYYYVMQYLKSMNPNLTTVKYTANPWEGYETSEERNAEAEKFINAIKNNKGPNPVKTIFLELGDNVNSAARRITFQTDITYLINRVKEEFPETKIYYLFGWYNYSQNIAAIQAATEATGIELIDYSGVYRGVTKKPFRGVTPSSCNRNTSFVGDKYITNVGMRKILQAGGGETHPGNYGFIAIADKVVSYLKEHDYGNLDSIKSTKYQVTSKYIKAKPTSKMLNRDTLLNNIVSSNSILLYNLNNNEVTSNVYIGTGYTLKSGSYALKIILKGDVTSDGVINLSDVSKVYNYYKKKTTLNVEQLEAAKITGSSSVTLGDVSRLYNYYKGKTTNLD